MNNDYNHYKVENAVDFLIDSQLKYTQYKKMIKVCLKSLIVSSDFSIKKLYSIKTWNTSKSFDENIDIIIDTYYIYVYFFMKNKESPKTVSDYLFDIINKNKG